MDIDIFIKLVSQFPRIDPAYLQSSGRVDVEGETKISVNSDELESWVDKRNQSNIETWKRNNPGIEFDPTKLKKTEKAGFTSECFFLTYRAFNLGFISGIKHLRNLYTEIRDLKSKKATVDANNPAYQRIERRISSLESVICCYHVQLHNVEFAKSVGKFYLFASSWLRWLVDPNNKGLPLDTPSMEYATMPEFVIDDIAEYFVSSIRVFRGFIDWFPLVDLVPLVVMLVGSPSHVKNPYLRGKLLEILYELVELKDVRDSAAVCHLLSGDKMVHNHLAVVLMKLYIDIEKTGSHSQFYSKFSVRHNIQEILKFMWKIPELRASIVKVSSHEDFIKFTSNVLADSIFLLDEGLLNLAEIRAFQLEKKDVQAWDALTPEQREEKEKNFQTSEARASHYCRKANNTVEMLSMLTSEILEPFMEGVLVSRVADMLNYFLEQMVGPKCTNLNVENREKYGFCPKTILGILVDVFLNLRHPTFIHAIGKDTRCYNHNAFLKASDIINKTGIRPPVS